MSAILGLYLLMRKELRKLFMGGRVGHVERICKPSRVL
jgi:hypothetical protein